MCHWLLKQDQERRRKKGTKTRKELKNLCCHYEKKEKKLSCKTDQFTREKEENSFTEKSKTFVAKLLARFFLHKMAEDEWNEKCKRSLDEFPFEMEKEMKKEGGQTDRQSE